MPRWIRCACQRHTDCRLCHGSGKYAYEPGPSGWMPFDCPTCSGSGRGSLVDSQRGWCLTCRGDGRVDPAMPPHRGVWDIMWKTLFGA